jgi:Predicted ATPase
VLFSEPGGFGRYGMLETVREYAREKLARFGDETELRQRHRDFYLNFAEEAAGHLTGPMQAEWLDRLEVEHDNLRSALDWCADDPARISIGLRLAGALRRFWLSRVHCAEGRRRYTDLLRKDSGAAPTSERALALQGAGNMAYRLGDYVAAGDLFELALAIRQEIKDRAGEAEMLANLGNVAYYRGEYQRSREYLSQALELLRETGNQANALVALHGLGNVAFRTSDHALARALHEQGLAESRDCGNRDMEAAFLVSLGHLHEAVGEPSDAKRRFEQSLVIARELGDLTQETVCLTNLGSVTLKLGDRPLSAYYYREGLLLARDRPGNRDERVVAYLLEGVGILGVEASNPWPAAWLLAAANALRESIAAPLPPQDKQEIDRAIAVGRSKLDAASFEAAWSEGGSAKVDVAISKALELAG